MTKYILVWIGSSSRKLGKVSIRVPIWKSTLNLCRFKYWPSLTDTGRHRFRVGFQVTNTRLVWEMSVSPTKPSISPVYLSVLANPSLPRGGKRRIWILTLTSQPGREIILLGGIFLNNPECKACRCRSTSKATNKSVDSIIKKTIQVWSTFAWLPIFHLGVLECGWCGVSSENYIKFTIEVGLKHTY